MSGCSRAGFLDRDVLDNLPGLEARRAHDLPFRNAVFKNPNFLQIRHPTPLRKIVGVRYVITGDRLLTANFATFGHSNYQLLLTKSHNIYTMNQKTRQNSVLG